VRWTFALSLVALVPFGALALGYFIYVLIMRKNDTKEFFEEAESQAVEATALIKTVKMLRCEKAQEATYNNRLEEYLRRMGKYPVRMGIATALFYFIQYFIFGVGFLFGIQCVRGTSACPVSVTGSLYSIGDMHIVFFQTYVCSYYFLQLASNYDSIKGAIVSSKEAFKFIS
jgi:ATP-binding cassette, subfamily B (MDR/TAP), member 1